MYICVDVYYKNMEDTCQNVMGYFWTGNRKQFEGECSLS